MPEENESNFKVTDRRKFHLDGTPREQSVEAESAIPAEETFPSPAAEVEGETAAEPEPVEPPPPQQHAQQQESSGGQGNVVSFPGEGERKKEQPGPTTEKDAEGKSSDVAGAAETAYNQTNRGKPSRLPEGPFLSLVNMLAFEAAIHLGLMQPPGGEEMTLDLESARPMIDMLGTLQEKTRGNLSIEEDTLLDNVLADLRMQFVALSRRR